MADVVIQRIDDAADPRLTDYFSLTDVALRRRIEPERGLYIAESAYVIERAVAAGHKPRSVMMADSWLVRMDELLAGLDPSVDVFVADHALLEQVTGFHVHRGALASMQRPALPSVDEIASSARRIVVLEDIVDHTNVGAIFRSVAALGADAIIVSPRCADPLYRRSVRVSMGAVYHVPWTRAQDWPSALDQLRAAGVVVAALALEPGAIALDDFSRECPERLALMLGTEGDGLSRSAIENADVVVRIPMLAGIDSLNVAAASAVAMWELRTPR